MLKGFGEEKNKAISKSKVAAETDCSDVTWFLRRSLDPGCQSLLLEAYLV